MADKYVSVAGGGTHDGSSAANAWTMAEATAAVSAGDMVNCLAGTYIADDSASSAVMDLDVSGTIAAFVRWRAYTTTIGDFAEGDAQPVILNAGTNTLTNCVLATTLTNAYNQFIGFRFTGASSTGFDGSNTVKLLNFVGCKFDANGALGLSAGNDHYLVSCEFTNNTTGAADLDFGIDLIRCLVHNEFNASGAIRANEPRALNCLFYDLGAAPHLKIQTNVTSFVIGCTFDGDGEASSVAVNTSGGATVVAAIYNNIFFDCSVGVKMNTANVVMSYGHNLFSNCTTDYETLTNDPTDISNSTDPFTNSGSRDYTLASGSAARSAGVDGGIF